MNKKVALISVLLICLLTGCSLVTNFQEAREEYLATRVVELLEEMSPTEDVSLDTPEATEVEPTEEVAATETIEPTEEVTEEVTEEATEEATATPEATEEATEEATATSEAKSLSADPAVYLGETGWEDNMAGTANWPTSTDEYLSVTYDNEKLKIVALSKNYGWRVASTEVLENAYIEATVQIDECSGKDGYGLYFRIPDKVDYQRGYFFGLTCDGYYALHVYDGLRGDYGQLDTLQSYTASELINQGEGQTNRLGVMTLDDRLIMFINGVRVGEVTDDSYDEGFFGVFINPKNTEELTIYVDDVKYWVNPEE